MAGQQPHSVHESVLYWLKDSMQATIHIDDSPANIETLREAGQHVVVFDQPYNSTYAGPRIDSWSDATLKSSSPSSSTGPSKWFVRRIVCTTCVLCLYNPGFMSAQVGFDHQFGGRTDRKYDLCRRIMRLAAWPAGLAARFRQTDNRVVDTKEGTCVLHVPPCASSLENVRKTVTMIRTLECFRCTAGCPAGYQVGPTA